MLKNMRLRNRMFVLIVGINFVMLLIIFGVYSNYSRKIVIAETQEKAKEKVDAVVSELEGFLKEKIKIGWTFCSNPYLKRWLETNTVRGADHIGDQPYYDIIHHFEELVEQDAEIKAAFLASEYTQEYYNHTTIEAGISAPDYYATQRPWYIQVKNLGRPRTAYGIDGYDSTIVIAYMHPIYNNQEKLIGIGGIDISLQNLHTYMSELDIFETGHAFIISDDSVFVYHSDDKLRKELILRKKISDFQDDGDSFENMDVAAQMILNGEEGIAEVVFEGEKRYFIIRPIKSIGWSLVLSVTTSEINAPIKSLARISAFLIAFISIFLVLNVILITSSIAKPINKLLYMIRDISEGEGDLTKRVKIESKDEIGELARWINIFMDKLHDIIVRVRLNTETVSSTTGVISSTSAQLAAGAEEQGTQSSDVATSVHEMTAAIIETAQNANQTAELAEQANKKALEGTEAMQATRQSMEEIVTSTARTGEVVETLSNRAGQIGEIINVIDDIADQTNLLALNAAIEAARAGEQGRGFAVVADEVRKLAERTTKATAEIAETIEAIRNETKYAFDSTSSSQTVVNEGKEKMVKMEEVLSEIVDSVTRAMDMVRQIAKASEEQSSGAEEISKNVEAISSVTKQTAGGAEELAKATDALRTQTEALMSVVNQFKLKDELYQEGLFEAPDRSGISRSVESTHHHQEAPVADVRAVH